MGTPLSDEDDELLELPQPLVGDDEAVGVEDADELLLNDLDDAPEEVGLDVESLGAADALSLLTELDQEEELSDGQEDDTPLDLADDLDTDDEEHGWTEDNEGASEGWEDDLPDDLDDNLDPDLGEEGVDDPLLDGLPDDHELPPVEDDEDEEEDEPLCDDSDELPPDLRQDA